MARAYLGAAGPRERLVVVAGESAARTARACHNLQRAAARLGVSSVLVRRSCESVDLEIAEEANPTLVLYDQGATTEQDARRLAGPSSRSVDLLLWCPSPGPGPRWIYLLSLWVWSLRPQQVRCIVEDVALGNGDLSALRFRLCKGLRRTQVGEGAELLRCPDTEDEESTSMFFQQILQSLLCASPNSNGRQLGQILRRATVASAAFAVVWLGLLSMAAAQSTSSSESSPTALVKILDFSRAEDTKVIGAHGSTFYHGPQYSLRLAPGVGAWSTEDESFSVTSRRSDTVFELDGQPVEWGSGSHQVKKSFVAHCREYSLLMGKGRVEMLPDGVVAHVVLGSNPLSRGGGALVPLVLAGIIFFLMWRANSLQRRLEKPRHSVRHTRPPPANESD